MAMRAVRSSILSRILYRQPGKPCTPPDSMHCILQGSPCPARCRLRGEFSLLLGVDARSNHNRTGGAPGLGTAAAYVTSGRLQFGNADLAVFWGGGVLHNGECCHQRMIPSIFCEGIGRDSKQLCCEKSVYVQKACLTIALMSNYRSLSDGQQT